MIILDTDHMTLLADRDSRQAKTLMANMLVSLDQDFATTAISVEEMNRGWLALINRHKDVFKQIPAYARLITLIRFFAEWRIVPFDEPAAEEFLRLRKEKIRIGTHDLKIAPIALAHQAVVLTANLRDFEQVPGLRVENWLE